MESERKLIDYEKTAENAAAAQAEKIKTHYARIVVDGTAEKPYYSIEWYDPAKQTLYLGYSSYYIKNVFNWLSENFEIVEGSNLYSDYVRAINRMGEFGKLFIEYTGCPRGAMGRACVPLQEEVLLMPPIRDVSGGEWIPVNADALRELVADYTSLLYSRAPKDE